MELIATFFDLHEAQDYVLAILAMNIDCLITTGENGYQIHPDSAFSIAIREEFKRYETEQREVKTPKQMPIFSAGVELFLLWAAIPFFCDAIQVKNTEITERFLNFSSRVMDLGKIYRPFTVLFLHDGIGHLSSNIALGASTATFGALALYQAWLVRTVRNGLRVVAPLAIGLMLFSMWGIGDGSGIIYIAAHLLGFGAGLIFGVPAELLRRSA